MVRAKKASHKKASARRKKRIVQKGLVPKDWHTADITEVEPAGLGPNAAGQSGDIENLPVTALGNSESVAELVEEGQDLEAEKVSGVENALDPDEGEVRTHGI